MCQMERGSESTNGRWHIIIELISRVHTIPVVVGGFTPMHSDPNAIFQAALALTEEERLALATRLMATVPEQSITLSLDDEDLEAELDRRFADQTGSTPWSELRKQG
jgi:hypothetical protein